MTVLFGFDDNAWLPHPELQEDARNLPSIFMPVKSKQLHDQSTC